MKHRFLFVFFALLLAVTSILAPAPDWLSKINISGSGGQLGLGEVSAADLSAVTVDSTVSALPGYPYSHQRHGFYAASRFWECYFDGTDLVYSSSLDGATWESPTVIDSGLAAAGNHSEWWDGTYIHIAEVDDDGLNDLTYCRGTPDEDGTITWGSVQNVIDVAANQYFVDLFVTVGTDSKPVITYVVDNPTDTTPYVIKSNQSDGTWTTDNFNTQLSATDSDLWKTNVLPLSDNNLIAIYVRDGQPIKSKTYNGSTWATENVTTSAIESGSYFSAVVDSSDIIHLVFLEDVTGDIQYTYWSEVTGAWAAEEEIYNGTSTDKAPVLSKSLNDGLYCFWIGDPIADTIYYKSCISGNWANSPVLWHSESNVADNASISCAYEQTTADFVPVAWLTGTSPYNVRFSAKERLLSYYNEMSISISPNTWTEFYQEGASTHSHNLRENSWYTSDNDTNKDYYTLTNNSGSSVDILISSADNWTGTGVTWVVSSTGTPGVSTIGLWAGLDSDSGYGRLIKPDDPANFLLTALAASAHDHFGLKVFTCTSNGGNATMTGQITLVAVVHT